MGHAFRSVATTQSRQPVNSNAAGVPRNRRKISSRLTPMRGLCEFSSCRTPIRYPRWGSGAGTRDIHNSLPAGNPSHSSNRTPMWSLGEISSCRTPIRHPRWGSEVGTPAIHNSQPTGQHPLSSRRVAGRQAPAALNPRRDKLKQPPLPLLQRSQSDPRSLPLNTTNDQ